MKDKKLPGSLVGTSISFEEKHPWRFVGEDTGPGQWYWNSVTGELIYLEQGVCTEYKVPQQQGCV
jgi:hypothetical protein